MLRRSLRLPPPRTLLPFSMLEILPDQTKSLEDNLSRGLQRLAFLDGRAKGQYVLKVGDTPITRAEDVPADPELLCVEARDDLARAEMVCFLARRDANMIKRTNDLRYLDKNDIPDVVLASTQQKTTQENNNVRKALNDIYVKCELSEVVPLPALQNKTNKTNKLRSCCNYHTITLSATLGIQIVTSIQMLTAAHSNKNSPVEWSNKVVASAAWRVVWQVRNEQDVAQTWKK